MKRGKTGSLRWLVLIFCTVAFAHAALPAAADPFRNLDFESAVIGAASLEVPASQGLPYWTNNSYHQGYVAYDDIALDSVCISIHDQHSGILKPLQGRCSVLLQDGWDIFGATPTNAYISQTGDVPSNARSLMFSTDMGYYVDHLVISLNGTPIPMQLYSVGPVINNPSGTWFGPVETYIGDISAFTGDTDVELRFTKLVQYPSDPYNHGAIDIDAITFSPTVIPEPSTLVLLAVAALAASARLFRRRRAAGE